MDKALYHLITHEIYAPSTTLYMGSIQWTVKKREINGDFELRSSPQAEYQEAEYRQSPIKGGMGKIFSESSVAGEKHTSGKK